MRNVLQILFYGIRKSKNKITQIGLSEYKIDSIYWENNKRYVCVCPSSKIEKKEGEKGHQKNKKKIQIVKVV